ncbi:MAG: Ig-like domain-containing protein [Candidatus Sulfotelmatobacter sp.]
MTIRAVHGCTTPPLWMRLCGLSLGILLLASCGGTSSNTVTTNPTLTSVAVTPAMPSIGIGATQQFAAIANYSDGSSKNVTSSANWSSSDATVAPVQSSGQANPGMASGVASGSATITASFSAVNGSTTLTVSNSSATLTSISIAPTAITLSVGGTMQFVATAGYSDGSSRIVTSSATWSSSDSTVASIQSTGQTTPGLATGVAPGNVNITVSYGTVGAVTTVNVITTTGKLSDLFIAQFAPSIAPGNTLQLFDYAEYTIPRNG